MMSYNEDSTQLRLPEEAIESKRLCNAWGSLLGEKVKIIDNRGEQAVWATSSKPDGSASQVLLEYGQIVSQDWASQDCSMLDKRQ